MPTVTRVAIRLALLQLVLAMALWTGLPLVAPHTDIPVMVAARAAWHLLAVGWLTQLIFGVAFWLFPTHKTEPKRGRPEVAWAGIVLLNAGLFLRLVGEPAGALSAGWAQPALVLYALCQVFAVILWVALLWPRVRGK